MPRFSFLVFLSHSFLDLYNQFQIFKKRDMEVDLHSVFFGMLLLVLSVSQTIISQHLANSDHTFPFKLSALVLSTEIAKVFIASSSILYDYVREKEATKKKYTPKTRTFLALAVPAFLYTVSNTLLYKTIAIMGSTNAQVWFNIRIVITAILCRVMVGRKMSVLQWISIFLLLAGVLSCRDHAGEFNQYSISPQAILYLLIQTTSSSFAGVYQEVLFKNNSDERIAVKSLALYFWTCFLSYAQWRYDSITDQAPFFQGFTSLTWISLLVNALYGQVVALALFFCDNLVKVFATSLGPITAVVLDAVYSGLGFQFGQVLGACIVLTSTITFYSKHEWLGLQDHQALTRLRVGAVDGETEKFNSPRPV